MRTPRQGGDEKGAALRYYPLFLDISGRRCIVVGGGHVAERKVARLLESGADVEVVSRVLTPVLAALKEEGRIVHHATDYEEALIRGAFLAIGATDSDAVNGRISEDARSLGIIVNIVDDPCRCDFILPALVERGELVIAVSTGGNSPALAKKLRRELEAVYGQEYGILAAILGELRGKVIGRGEPPERNQEKFTALVASGILELIRAKRWEAIEALIMELTGIKMEVGPW
jgi:precorrin-2 dehydrogenase/sirohydrochlorin ferrochelatase